MGVECTESSLGYPWRGGTCLLILKKKKMFVRGGIELRIKFGHNRKIICVLIMCNSHDKDTCHFLIIDCNLKQ